MFHVTVEYSASTASGLSRKEFMLEAVNIFQTSNTGSANIYFSLSPSKASTVLKSSVVYKICIFSQFCVMLLLYIAVHGNPALLWPTYVLNEIV